MTKTCSLSTFQHMYNTCITVCKVYIVCYVFHSTTLKFSALSPIKKVLSNISAEKSLKIIQFKTSPIHTKKFAQIINIPFVWSWLQKKKVKKRNKWSLILWSHDLLQPADISSLVLTVFCWSSLWSSLWNSRDKIKQGVMDKLLSS